MIQILPHEKIDIFSKYKDVIEEVDTVRATGRVEKITGLTIESHGPDVQYGELCRIRLKNGNYLYAEVVGFNKNKIILMPIGDMKGVVPGADVYAVGSQLYVPVGDALIGRVIDGLGNPIDGKGKLFLKERYPVDNKPLSPLEREIIDSPLPTGIRAIDGLITVGKGQRMGIFSGSGVGKSTLISMIARNTAADISVIALIGERGREAKDFVEKELQNEGLKRSVVIISTSDQPPMLRLRAGFLAHSVAEYFRDKGLHVNLLMDSVTRFAMAQREVGLAAGQPAATRGYPPSVFSLLPQLLERAGNKKGAGSITGFYSILVEADDMNEPIADAVRGILDGHIVLDRKLAHKNHYPAIDVLGSISRCMNDVIDEEHKMAANTFRKLLAAYREAEDLIMLGAYAKGSDPDVDKAIEMKPAIDSFLQQGIYEKDTYENIKNRLIELMLGTKAKPAKRQEFAARTPYFAQRSGR
ncbi:MAG: FliI/YscN family ATPase [Spirochaetes bacterium]|nr:FliI/YscN family ATPase [Spirochaetota bacterium]